MATFSTRARTLTELATAVRDARTAAGMSQVELASAAGLTRSWISLFEGGHTRNPSLSRIFAMCDVLGIVIHLTYPLSVDDDGESGGNVERLGKVDVDDVRNDGDEESDDEPIASPSAVDPAALAAARSYREAHRARALAADLAGAGPG